MYSIKKIPLTKLIKFENKYPICIFYSSEFWFVKSNVIPRLKTSGSALKFTTYGKVKNEQIYYKFSTVLNYIVDCNHFDLITCNKAKFDSTDTSMVFSYFPQAGERIVIPLLPQFEQTSIYFTLSGVNNQASLIIRVEN